MNMLFFLLTASKRNDIWTNVTQNVYEAREERERDRQRKIEIVIGTGW